MAANDAKGGLYGLLSEFESPSLLVAAVRQVRDAGYKHWDVHTPFPVHGMDEAMGLKRSWVPWATAALALTGIAAAQAMMNYIMVHDWPMNFGGKPFFAWPSFVPITFELMVLFGAIGTAIIAIRAGKRDTIPQPPPMLIETGATIDRFVLWISATDPEFDDKQTMAFVESIGAKEVRVVEAQAGGETKGGDHA